MPGSARRPAARAGAGLAGAARTTTRSPPGGPVHGGTRARRRRPATRRQPGRRRASLRRSRRRLEQWRFDARPEHGRDFERRARGGGSGATRASTASRTVGGTPAAADASSSVTKKGLPPLMRCRACASTARAPARRRTASADSRGSAMRAAPGKAPSTRRNGWSGRSRRPGKWPAAGCPCARYAGRARRAGRAWLRRPNADLRTPGNGGRGRGRRARRRRPRPGPRRAPIAAATPGRRRRCRAADRAGAA